MFRRQILRQSHSISETLTASSQGRRSPFSSASFASPRPCLPASYSLRTGQRWQSTEAGKKADDNSSPNPEQTKAPETKEDPTKQELEKAKKEIIELKDKYLRSVADYRNLQDRTKRETESAKQFALQRFATDLLDSIDNLDRALTAVPQEALSNATTSNTSSPDPNAAAASESTSEAAKHLTDLHAGLMMTEGILMSTLKKHGIERFDPLEGEGRKFDPNTDEATFFAKVDGKQDGEVFFTQSKGYKLNGRVLRAAKVGVVKNQ